MKAIPVSPKRDSDPSDKMPVLFLGHGSPMNAIAKNDFTKALNGLGQSIPQPRAILVISAHWMTQGTWVTHMAKPKTIHDFYGFPKALFDVQYPAPGSPQLADQIRSAVDDPKIGTDDQEWGLDHGTWSVLKHLYPAANVPVVQLSLDMTKPPEFHFDLGRKLAEFRKQGVLIVGSGNIVHNLGRINWQEGAPAFDWAQEFDAWITSHLENREFTPLIKDATKSAAGKLSIPSYDHYFPLLYTLGAAEKQDQLAFDYKGIELGSISMRCLRFF